MGAQQIILRDVTRPKSSRVDYDIHWMISSLGFERGRDTEHMTFRIVDKLLHELREQERVSSEQLAEELKVSAARINHHVRNLVESGFLGREKKRIVLRGGSVLTAIREMRRDADRMFDELESRAALVDKRLGLEPRYEFH